MVHKWNVTVITEIVLVHLLNMNPCPLSPLFCAWLLAGLLFSALRPIARWRRVPEWSPFAGSSWQMARVHYSNILYILNRSFWKKSHFQIDHSYTSKPFTRGALLCRKPPPNSLDLESFLPWKVTAWYFEVILPLFRKLFKTQLLIRVPILSQAEQIKQTKVESLHVTAPWVFSRNYTVLSR